MAIEALLERVAVALETNNDLLTKAAEGRERAIAAAEAVSSTAAGAKTKAKPAEKPAESAPAAETKTEAPAAETAAVSEVQQVVAAYIGADGISDAEKTARNEKVKGVLSHPKVNAKKVSDVPKALEGAVIKAVRTLIEAGNVLADDTSEEEEVDLMG